MDLTVGGPTSRGVMPYKFPPAPDGPAPPDNAFMLMGYVPSWGDIVRVQVNTGCVCVCVCVFVLCCGVCVLSLIHI